MKNAKPVIKDISGATLENNAAIVRQAFGTVADELGLNVENCPRFPAFATTENLEELRARGAVFYGLFVDGFQAGFVAVEQESDGAYYMKRLAVLPEYRHGGYGRELISCVIEHVKKKGSRKLSIAIVNEQTVLKNWYKDMGFSEVSIKEFEQLPFRVCFMEKHIS